MAVDTPEVQRGIAKWSFVVIILVSGITYFAGIKQFTYGLLFGFGLCIINYRIVGFILEIAFRLASADLARVISFAGYHVRFWLIVIILYLVIPRTHYLFGLGAFVGLLLPKMIMGVFVVMHTDDEWWNKEVETSGPTGETVEKKKGDEEPIRFPGLDFDDRFKDQGLNGPDNG